MGVDSKIVDKAESGSVFLKLGKPWYLSKCPNYEGYWLNGSIGSVQCGLYAELFPGVHQHLFCAKNCENCPVRKEKEK